ncbi:hypothetical protein VIGAN_05085900 [Vigna angularis var. angularis]|uniref:Pectate lyase n=1 Tax=Vigna angularis var. angularis TaxID=157739 RepID=A0A0S3S3R8_PHAAN|nr:hypothetical protein VIGAN_05085900 [Vigna angularis var. angularis]
MATLTILLMLSACSLLTLASPLNNRDSTKEFDALSPIPSYITESSPKNVVMNTIDSCWRGKTNWASNRQSLADCAIGFGKDAIGGKFGDVYEVTDPSDDPVDPKPGTLRYGAIQTEPLWITFAKDMVISLKNELMVNSYKSIDGRGAKVEIANGACITIQGVSHVIIHGISIHDCKPGDGGMVRSTPEHVGYREGSDGDAISIFASSNVWIDHCFLARCTDGLIDVIHASTAVTISNNYFTHHDKVTKRESSEKWNNWKWRSYGDEFLNGAYFVPSGYGSCSPLYSSAQTFTATQASMVPFLTLNAGPLNCVLHKPC